MPALMPWIGYPKARDQSYVNLGVAKAAAKLSDINKKMTADLLHINKASCLTGGCGSGPNMILMPGEVPLRHISTPAKVTDVLRRLCALEVPDSLLKVMQWPALIMASSL